MDTWTFLHHSRSPSLNSPGEHGQEELGRDFITAVFYSSVRDPLVPCFMHRGQVGWGLAGSLLPSLCFPSQL